MDASPISGKDGSFVGRMTLTVGQKLTDFRVISLLIRSLFLYPLYLCRSGIAIGISKCFLIFIYFFLLYRDST